MPQRTVNQHRTAILPFIDPGDRLLQMIGTQRSGVQDRKGSIMRDIQINSRKLRGQIKNPCPPHRCCRGLRPGESPPKPQTRNDFRISLTPRCYPIQPERKTYQQNIPAKAPTTPTNAAHRRAVSTIIPPPPLCKRYPPRQTRRPPAANPIAQYRCSKVSPRAHNLPQSLQNNRHI